MVFVGCHIDDTGKTVRYKGEHQPVRTAETTSPAHSILFQSPTLTEEMYVIMVTLP